jgi:hypothetical protein
MTHLLIFCFVIAYSLNSPTSTIPQSPIHPLLNQLTHPLTRSPSIPLNQSIYPLPRLLSRSFTPSPTHSPVHSLPHLLIHSLAYLHTHSHSLTHSLHCFKIRVHALRHCYWHELDRVSLAERPPSLKLCANETNNSRSGTNQTQPSYLYTKQF